MKKLLFCIGTLIAVLFSSCSSSDLEVQYFPFKEDASDKWGLINAEGEILSEDEFEHRPSLVVNDYFFVEEKNGKITVYKATEDSPTEIIDGLHSAGYMSEGLIPVAKKDKRICYVNKEGEEQFTLDPISGNEITKVSSFFSDGLAIICVAKENKETGYPENKYGAINTKGEVVIDPEYDFLEPFKNGLAVALKNSDDDSKNKYLILNTDGEEVGSYKAEDYEGRYNNYCVFESKGNESIVDISDECKDLYALKKEQSVYGLSDNYIVFRDSESGKYGVKKYDDPEILFKGDFDGIAILKEGGLFSDDTFFAGRDDNKGRYYNADGEIIEDIDEIKGVANPKYIPGFLNYFDWNDCILKETEDGGVFLNNDLEEVGKHFDKLGLDINEWVYSNYSKLKD